MAKQRGVVKIIGTIDDLTFLKTRDGYQVRERTSLTGDRVRTDVAFKRTMENAAEFGRAGKAAKLMRASFDSLLRGTKKYRLTARLQKQIMGVIKADITSARGLRNVVDGDILLAEGFNFNSNAALESTLLAPFDLSINRTTGAVSVDFDPFVPAERLAIPAGATHFKLRSCAAEMDFLNQVQTSVEASSTVLDISNLPTAAIALSTPVTAATTKVIMVTVGISFYQKVNGIDYPLSNGAFNAVKLVKVSKV